MNDFKIFKNIVVREYKTFRLNVSVMPKGIFWGAIFLNLLWIIGFIFPYSYLVPGLLVLATCLWPLTYILPRKLVLKYFSIKGE